jgi:hypothetical protein
MPRNNDAKNYGCGCAVVAILLMISLMDKYWEWTLVAGVVLIIVLLVYNKNQKQAQIKVDFAPEFEIKYRKNKSDITVRKITVVKLGEFLDAYCFLRNSVCTFAFSKIIECVDLSTGEKVNDDLRVYYAKSRVKTIKPIDVFDLRYWEPIRYSSFMDLPSEISGFKLNQKFMMDVVTFKYGERIEEFICNRIIRRENESERFCVELIDSSNKKLFVGMSKIISVEGIEDFGEYLTEKFYEYKADKEKSV